MMINKKSKKENIKNHIKEYDLLIYSIIKSKNNATNAISSKIIQNKDNFRKYFLNNIKKSTFLAQILPSILFLVISLISFSLVVLNSKETKFGFWLYESNLIIPTIAFSVVFFVLGILLIIQNVVFKTKVINIQYVYRSGYYNISSNDIKEIMELV